MIRKKWKIGLGDEYEEFLGSSGINSLTIIKYRNAIHRIIFLLTTLTQKTGKRQPKKQNERRGGILSTL